MIIVRGREGLHFDKHLGLYCRVGIVQKHTQSLPVALCDITQCTIYQHHLPGTFSLLDPAALLSESFSVLRGTPCCHNTHHHMAKTPRPILSQISDQSWSMRDQNSTNSSSLGKFGKWKDLTQLFEVCNDVPIDIFIPRISTIDKQEKSKDL